MNKEEWLNDLYRMKEGQVESFQIPKKVNLTAENDVIIKRLEEMKKRLSQLK